MGPTDHHTRTTDDRTLSADPPTADPTADDRTLSAAETMMWRLEADRHLSSTFANITVLDRPPDLDRLRRRMERAVRRIPRLRRCIRPGFANLTPARWVDDPEFDLDTHIRHIALPAPGTERQLLDLAALVLADPFDPDRPLWQFVVVDGLTGGRAALIEKLHHTITDGEGGVRLAMEFLDLQRDAPGPHPTGADGDEDDDDAASPPQPGTADADLAQADAVRTALASALRIPLGVVEQVRELLAEPERIPAATATAGDTLAGLLDQVATTDRACSPLWTDRSLHRHIVVGSAPFDDTRRTARRLGGTLNTAFLTLAAEAAGRYHTLSGAPVDALRASMAVSTRTVESGANAFTLARLLVPTAPMPIAERFRAVDDAVRCSADRSTLPGLEVVATLAAPLPTAILTRLARQQADTVDFATSNVKGSPVPLYVAGARLLHNHPVGPLGGVAFNLTLLSHDGSLDMGMNIDSVAVADPALLEACLADAVDEFTAAAG